MWLQTAVVTNLPNMNKRAPVSLISALGLTAELDQLYPQLLGLSGGDLATVSSYLQCTADELTVTLQPLLEHRIAEIVEGRGHGQAP